MSEYDPAYQTPCFSNASPMHLQSSSVYSDALHIRLCMLHNSALPPASAPLPCCPHLFVCLFVSPSRLFLLIDGQWTSAKSDCTHSIRRGLSRRFQNLSPSSFPSPTTMVTLEEQVTLLTQQIQVLQNQLSAWSLSPPVDPPPLPTTTKLPKITAPTPFTGLQDDLNHFKAECSLYICLQGSEFPNNPTHILSILSYITVGATG